VNHLEEGGNDTVQPCEARSDSDFGIKIVTVQFYAIKQTPNPTVGSS
jgi:hypothetical protein